MSDLLINIIKDPSLFERLIPHNTELSNITSRYNFSSTYDLAHDTISPWFNPANVRNLGLSRTYPHMDACQYRREYSLYLHCSNYLPLFLINTLYPTGCSSADPLVEDIGGGMGWLFFYLKKCGYNNFHLVENFSQLSQRVAEDFIKHASLNCHINAGLKSTVTNNVGVPGVLYREITDNLELITFYTNRSLERDATQVLVKNGFTFLCRDSDDLSVAYCRNDLHKQFNEILLPYAC